MLQTQNHATHFSSQTPSAHNTLQRDAADIELNAILGHVHQRKGGSRISSILRLAALKSDISLISLVVSPNNKTILEARITDDEGKSHVLVASHYGAEISVTFDTLHFLSSASMLQEPIFKALFAWLENTASRILPTESITTNTKAISVMGIDWANYT